MHTATIGQPVGVHVEMTLVTCASCGIAFGMPSDLNRRRREDGKDFHCPNGHVNVYKSDLESLRKQLADAKAAQATAESARVRAEKLKEDTEKALQREQAAHAETKKKLVFTGEDRKIDDAAPPPAKPPVPTGWVTMDERIVKCLSDGKIKHYKDMAMEMGVKPDTLNPALSKAHAKKLVVREGPGMYRLPTTPS